MSRAGAVAAAVAVTGFCAALIAPASLLSAQQDPDQVAAAAGRPVAQRVAGFQSPLVGAVLSQPFGCTAYVFELPEPACPGRHWHSGVDLAAPAGARVVATLPGRVAVVVSAFGYGVHVLIDHGAGLSSLYGHLSEVVVPDGAVVDAGTPIGSVGSTGNSTGPHLHFEVRRDGIAEDPRLDVHLP